MATIGRPTKKYNVKNCAVAHVDDPESGYSPEYYQHTDAFMIELQDSSRTEVEAISNNNPIEINITGEMNEGGVMAYGETFERVE